MAKKFYQLSPFERRKKLKEQKRLNSIELPEISIEQLNQLSENVVGRLNLPLSVVLDVQVNDESYNVPMVTEEPSVVAAANHATRIFNQNGGAKTSSKRDGLYGQAFFMIDESFELTTFSSDLPDLISDLNETFASLVKHGGGVREIIPYITDDLLELRVLVDPAQAMGANKINSILEDLSDQLIDYPGISEKLFAILSNYPSQFATAKVELDFTSLSKQKDATEGKLIAEKIALLSQIAQTNPYRATTNNKGIMNGVDAVLLATGNDFRAVEVAVHNFASQTGAYQGLASWEVINNQLVGELTLPLPIGVVGGSINTRKDVKEAYEILGHPNVSQLAEVIATIGLANNFAALLAISTKGIQAGHMKLQAKNLALSAGATMAEQDEVVQELIATADFSMENAREIITNLRGN